MGLEAKLARSSPPLRQIRRAAEIGREIQERHPEIAQEYRDLETRKRLALDHGITERYRVSLDIAITAVYFALFGADRSYTDAPYAGLIPDDEVDAVRAAHFQENGRRAQEQGKGIFARTAEQRREHGERMYAQRKGIHALTAEEQREASREGGRSSAIATGKHAWDEELEYLFSQAVKKEYRSRGRHPRYYAEKLAQALTERFGHEHTARQVKAIMYEKKVLFQQYRRRRK